MEQQAIPQTHSELIKKLRRAHLIDPRLNAMICERARVSYPAFNLVCRNPKAQRIYEDAAYQVNLNHLVLWLGTSLQLFGEGIVYGYQVPSINNHEFLVWGGMQVLAPEMVEMKREILSGRLLHYLRPSPELMALVKDNPGLFNQGTLACIRDGHLVPLDLEFVSSIQRLGNTLDVRGTPSYKYDELLKTNNLPDDALDKFDSPAWLADRKKDRDQMQRWLYLDFFGPVMRWNSLAELPEIVWSNQLPEVDQSPSS